MIKKYLKCTLVLVLMFALFLSMYGHASIDGDASSFVTKEEFDLALSAFNKRLSSFEAGINSKIDSQVTSYLDRNGIWSKKIQETEFETSGCWNASEWSNSVAPAGDYYGRTLSSNKLTMAKNTDVAGNKVYLIPKDRDWVSKTFVTECKKGGLLLGDICFRFDAHCGNPNTGYIYHNDTHITSPACTNSWSYYYHLLAANEQDYDHLITTTQGTGDLGRYGFSCAFLKGNSGATRGVSGYYNNEADLSFEILGTGDVLKTHKSIIKITADGMSYDTIQGITYVTFSPITYNLKFFVEKGEKLNIRCGWQATGRETPNMYITSLSSLNGNIFNPYVLLCRTRNIEIY